VNLYINQRNAAAAAVAAHECGHAVQHARAYSYLTLRSQLVPIVSISSKFSQWLVIGGLIIGELPLLELVLYCNFRLILMGFAPFLVLYTTGRI